MLKRFALALFCVLFMVGSTLAATTPTGDWWVGGGVSGVFTLDRSVNTSFKNFNGNSGNVSTAPGVGVNVIGGYNFTGAQHPWNYFGLALDYSWNQFNNSSRGFSVNGGQNSLSFLARAQYPLMKDKEYPNGRFIPFAMFGPAIVWSNSNFSNFNAGGKNSTNVGIVTEVGFEYFMVPHLSIGPSVRYRHTFGPSYTVQNVKVNSNTDQFSIIGRVAYHF